MTNDTHGIPEYIDREAELAAIALECEHEDEVEALREDEQESDYFADPSGQS